MSLNLYPMLGALIGQSINSEYVIWSRWKNNLKGYQCAKRGRDSVQAASVWSLSYQRKSTQFVSIPSARALLGCCLAAAVLCWALSIQPAQPDPSVGCRVWQLAWLAGGCIWRALFVLFYFAFLLYFFVISSGTIYAEYVETNNRL